MSANRRIPNPTTQDLAADILGVHGRSPTRADFQQAYHNGRIGKSFDVWTGTPFQTTLSLHVIDGREMITGVIMNHDNPIAKRATGLCSSDEVLVPLDKHVPLFAIHAPLLEERKN